MSAAKHDITLEQGSDFALEITINDSDGDAMDLTSHTAFMYVSDNRDDSPDFTLSSGAGLTLGGTAGTIDVAITDTQVDALTWSKGEYDLVVVDASGIKTRRLSGSVFVSEEVPTS